MDALLSDPKHDPVEIPDPAPAPAPNPHFTLGRWQTFTQWKCAYCPYDTLQGEAVIMEHYQERHAPPPEPAPAPRLIQVADRSGNPVD
jgi:hypothetical protein